MNYYERIQKSIDFIENNLENEITIEDCAKEAFMSVSGYYRFFLSIVGYNVKEYIRLRRLTLAFKDIQNHKDRSVMTIAVKYMYNSADSFSRAFKKQFGYLPSELKSENRNLIANEFERINIMDKFFEMDDRELIEKYPDIKIIKELQDMKVACFTYFGPDPESNAYEELKKWMKENEISLAGSGYRIFGYNNPDPAEGDELYAYEMCVTISDELYETLPDIPKNCIRTTYDSVKRRVLKGGKYAVLAVKRDAAGDVGTGIMQAWKRFSMWMEEGKYIWSERQYLEEHLGFNQEDDHIGGVELYLPIEKAPNMQKVEKREITIEKSRVALFHVEGNDPEKNAQECWGKALEWAKENRLNHEECRIYQFTKGFDPRPPFFHNIMITLPESFDETRYQGTEEVSFCDFPGGKYMSMPTDIQNLGNAWKHMEQWRKETKTKGGKHQWVEEWVLDNWDFPYKEIRVCYPIQ